MEAESENDKKKWSQEGLQLDTKTKTLFLVKPREIERF